MGIFKYAIIGGICTLLDLSIFVFFTQVLAMHYLLVSTASFSTAVFLNYYLCIKYLFVAGVRFTTRMEILSFFVISLIGLLIHQTMLFSAVDLAGLDLIFSKMVATAAVFAWNYFGRKCYVFRPRRLNSE